MERQMAFLVEEPQRFKRIMYRFSSLIAFVIFLLNSHNHDPQFSTPSTTGFLGNRCKGKLLSLHSSYTLSTTIISIALSLHLMLLAPVNSCVLHNYYLVLSFLLMYSSSGLSTDVFPNKTNINTHWVSPT